MEQFKESKCYVKIKNELHSLQIEKEIANFDCYVDNIFSYYYYHDDNLMHEFSIICDDIMLSKMHILELLELKHILYFSHRVYDISIPNSHEKLLAKIEWKDGDNEYLKLYEQN
jgi:hypothetical protein